MFLHRDQDQPNEQTPHGVTHHVLCIVDDPPLVEALGVHIQEAPDFAALHPIGGSDEVMVVAKRVKPSVVLLDFDRSGDVSAMTILNELRRDVPDARVVVMSGAPNGELVARSLSHGAAGLVTKGLSADRLVHAMRRVLGGDAVIMLDATT
ncbi:MAG: response regulator [Gemmatimonadaceae bacterium]